MACIAHVGFDKKSRQIHVSMLAQKADVSEENILRGRRNKKFVKWQDSRNSFFSSSFNNKKKKREVK